MTIGVIGSSVAGCMAANRLALHGHKVFLFDKKVFPRKKPCGGGLTNKTLKLLKQEGIKLPPSDQYPYVEYIHKFSILCPENIDKSEYKIVSGQTDKDVLALVNRFEFDDWLKNQLPENVIHISDIIYGWETRNVISPNPISLIGEKRKYDVTHFIACDGVNSIFGKLAHGSYPATEVIQACEAIVPNHCGRFADVIQNPTQDPLNGGYSWIFAKEKTANIGTGVVRNYDKHYGYYKEWMKKIAVDYYKYPAFKEYTENWVIPLFKYGRRMYPNTFNGVVAGDALGCADIWFAEGIYGGMLNAVEAAKWIHAHHSFEGFQTYWYKQPYARAMAALNFLQTQSNGDYIQAFNLLKQPGVLDRFLEMISGEIKPQQVVRWVNLHYMYKSIKLYLTAKKNTGSEKSQLKYVT